MSDTKKKILVGMSGGVDSSAAALILRDQGHEVAGLTFELWDSEDGTCGTKNDVRDAAEVCRVLGIPHFVVDFRKEFRQQVMERFVQDYRHGLTPNPCVTATAPSSLPPLPIRRRNWAMTISPPVTMDGWTMTRQTDAGI